MLYVGLVLVAFFLRAAPDLACKIHSACEIVPTRHQCYDDFFVQHEKY